jgi:AcrR family transcriptional regulator
MKRTIHTAHRGKEEKMGKRGRKSIAEQRRAEICEAFRRCALRDGLYGASNRKVAKEAGVSLSMLHHYFDSREEMVESLVRAQIEEFDAQLLSQDVWQDRIEDRLPKILDFAFGDYMMGPDTGNYYFDLLGQARRNERLRKIAADMWRDLRKKTAAWLTTGDEMGLSRREAENLATMLAAMYQGIFLLWNIDPSLPMKSLNRLMKEILGTYFREMKKKQDTTRGPGKDPKR